MAARSQAIAVEARGHLNAVQERLAVLARTLSPQTPSSTQQRDEEFKSELKQVLTMLTDQVRSSVTALTQMKTAVTRISEQSAGSQQSFQSTSVAVASVQTDMRSVAAAIEAIAERVSASSTVSQAERAAISENVRAVGRDVEALVQAVDGVRQSQEAWLSRQDAVDDANDRVAKADTKFKAELKEAVQDLMLQIKRMHAVCVDLRASTDSFHATAGASTSSNGLGASVGGAAGGESGILTSASIAEDVSAVRQATTALMQVVKALTRKKQELGETLEHIARALPAGMNNVPVAVEALKATVADVAQYLANTRDAVAAQQRLLTEVRSAVTSSSSSSTSTSTTGTSAADATAIATAAAAAAAGEQAQLAYASAVEAFRSLAAQVIEANKESAETAVGALKDDVTGVLTDLTNAVKESSTNFSHLKDMVGREIQAATIGRAALSQQLKDVVGKAGIAASSTSTFSSSVPPSPGLAAASGVGSMGAPPPPPMTPGMLNVSFRGPAHGTNPAAPGSRLG